jgi:DNA adenine methylase
MTLRTRGDDVVDDFRYPGGKGVSGVYHTLLRLQPPHQLYIEPFLGKSKMMRTKRPAITSIGIDVDANVTKWWKRQLRREDVPGLSVWHGDALELLPNAIAMGGAARDQTLIYADPEYLETVTTRARYPHRFGSEAKHKRLLTMLVQLADRGCMVMVSGITRRSTVRCFAAGTSTATKLDSTAGCARRLSGAASHRRR